MGIGRPSGFSFESGQKGVPSKNESDLEGTEQLTTWLNQHVETSMLW